MVSRDTASKSCSRGALANREKLNFDLADDLFSHQTSMFVKDEGT